MIQFFITFTLFQTLLFASFTGTIIDKNTLNPVVGATISDTSHEVKSDINGWFHFATDEKTFQIVSYGYNTMYIQKNALQKKYKLTKTSSKTSKKASSLPLSSNLIIDENTLQPINGAIISDSTHSVKSDLNGKFDFKTNEKMFHIKAYGYKALHIKKDSDIKSYKMTPINVKALYLTFWGASGNSATMKKIFKIIENTEANAVVVDIKNEYGSTLFLTSFEQANSYGAQKNRTNRNISRFMKMMKDRGIYTIARIVTFKDEIQASHNPDYAIKNQKGEIWRNHDNMAWVDPYDSRSHDYAIRMAEEAAKVGFDEINFDYIRFPAKADLVFSKEHTQENRVKAINIFLDSAKQKLQKYGVYISVDTYGNILWTKKGDNNIGQTVKSLAEHADYLAPMLYPSGFARGSFGKENPSSHPYIVIYRSIKHIEKIISPARVRPWLQYFRDYAHTKMYYKKHEVREQIRASEKMNTNGWMMWSPSSKYHSNYFKANK
ncbi:GTP-binding protein [Sulfurimonas sp.]|nr:GTP-binding protein [Sulfurimonas sp.]